MVRNSISSILFLTLFGGCIDPPTSVPRTDTGVDSIDSIDSTEIPETWKAPELTKRVVATPPPVESTLTELPIFIRQKVGDSDVAAFIGDTELATEVVAEGVWVIAPKLVPAASVELYFDGERDGPPAWEDSHFILHFDGEPADSSRPQRLIDGSAPLTDGIFSQSARFDVGDGYKTQSFPAGFVDPSSAVTLEFWFKFESIVSGRQVVVEMLDGETGVEIVHDNGLAVRWSVEDQNDIVVDEYTSTTVIDDNAWHHFGFVVDRIRGETEIYIDGVRTSTGSISSPGIPPQPAESTFSFGNGAQDGEPMLGRLEEMRLHSARRSAEWLQYQYRLRTEPVEVSAEEVRP